jgi:hypothetical protein
VKTVKKDVQGMNRGNENGYADSEVHSCCAIVEIDLKLNLRSKKQYQNVHKKFKHLLNISKALKSLHRQIPPYLE